MQELVELSSVKVKIWDLIARVLFAESGTLFRNAFGLELEVDQILLLHSVDILFVESDLGHEQPVPALTQRMKAVHSIGYQGLVEYYDL